MKKNVLVWTLYKMLRWVQTIRRGFAVYVPGGTQYFRGFSSRRLSERKIPFRITLKPELSFGLLVERRRLGK